MIIQLRYLIIINEYHLSGVSLVWYDVSFPSLFSPRTTFESTINGSSTPKKLSSLVLIE